MWSHPLGSLKQEDVLLQVQTGKIHLRFCQPRETESWRFLNMTSFSAAELSCAHLHGGPRAPHPTSCSCCSPVVAMCHQWPWLFILASLSLSYICCLHWDCQGRCAPKSCWLGLNIHKNTPPPHQYSLCQSTHLRPYFCLQRSQSFRPAKVIYQDLVSKKQKERETKNNQLFFCLWKVFAQIQTTWVNAIAS